MPSVAAMIATNLDMSLAATRGICCRSERGGSERGEVVAVAKGDFWDDLLIFARSERIY